MGMKRMLGVLSLMVTGILVLASCVFIFSLLTGISLATINTFAPALREPFLRWLQGDDVEPPEWSVSWREEEEGTGQPPDCTGIEGPLSLPSRFPLAGFTPDHPAQDFLAPAGAPVVSPVRGLVVWAGPRLVGYGEMVIVQEGKRNHVLSPLVNLQVKAGDVVNRGQPVGRVAPAPDGNTPYFRYAVYDRGRAVDPIRLMDSDDPCDIPPPGDLPTPSAAAAIQNTRVEWHLPPGTAAWGVVAPLRTGENTGLLARALYGNRPLYLWPQGRPDLAQKGGIQAQGVRTVVVGPEPGQAWAVWRTPDTGGILISIMEGK